MAATYYSQILHAYNWAWMAETIDLAIESARSKLVADPASSPTDGFDYNHNGMLANATYDESEQDITASVYLGRTYRDSPSGSFYAPWSAVPDRIREKDAYWYEAFEKVAAKHGLYIMSGEGDPTDTYAYKVEPLDV